MKIEKDITSIVERLDDNVCNNNQNCATCSRRSVKFCLEYMAMIKINIHVPNDCTYYNRSEG